MSIEDDLQTIKDISNGKGWMRRLSLAGIIAITLGFVFLTFFLQQQRTVVAVKDRQIENRVDALNQTLSEARVLLNSSQADEQVSPSTIEEVLDTASGQLAAIRTSSLTAGGNATGATDAIVNPTPQRLRLFIQISREDQRSDAEKLGAVLASTRFQGHSIVVPKIELVETRGVSTLRCLKRADCQMARDLAELINSQLTSPDITVLDLSYRYDTLSSVRAGTFELWFDKSSIVLRDSAGKI